MQNWVPSLDDESGPKYAAIADAIAAAIRTGELRPGERLPPQRALADSLRVDLTTVTRAYGLARAAGLIEGAGKLGSFVRNDAMLPVVGETTSDANMNLPPQPGFALLPEAIRSGTAELLRAGRHSPILQYQPSAGNMLDRAAAAVALTEQGIPTEPEQVVITAGAQNALHALLGTAFAEGDAICCGPFVYSGFKALAARLRLRLDAVASDEEGLVPDAVEQVLRQGSRAIYLTATNDNPTTATMGLARREAIVAVARRHGAAIVEDDAYGLLPVRPVPPLASLAPERTWYITGTSKIISPVLRVAHLRLPEGTGLQPLARDVHETSVMAPPLNAALVTLWLRNGWFDRLVAGVRAEAVARQRIAAKAMTGLSYAAHPQGYHLWLEVPSGNTDGLVAAVRPLGLSAVAADAFAVSDADRSFVRLSMGGPIDHVRLERALRHAARFCVL